MINSYRHGSNGWCAGAARRATRAFGARKISSDISPSEGRFDTNIARIAVVLSYVARFVRPRRTLHVLEDEPDSRILECAVAGRVDAIVTGDRALLALREFNGVQIVSLREYLSSHGA